MGYPFIRYYVIKDALRFINTNITYMQDISNTMLFKYALFYDAEEFYKLMSFHKIDSYQISSKIKNNFLPFLKEILHMAYVHASLEEQLFCYYIFISYIVNLYISDYIDDFHTKKKDKAYIERMLETYFFNKNEKLKLHSINVADYFFDSFELSQTDINLLEKPIKRVFGFFCTKNYYLECYQSARFYYDYLSISKTGLKKPLFFLYDLLLNHRKYKKKARSFLYPKRLDTTILNLNNRSYMLQDLEVTYSIDELYQVILKEVRRICDILNSYFTGNENLKPLEKYFSKEPITKKEAK